jgi:hypothetical protein
LNTGKKKTGKQVCVAVELVVPVHQRTEIRKEFKFKNHEREKEFLLEKQRPLIPVYLWYLYKYGMFQGWQTGTS